MKERSLSHPVHRYKRDKCYIMVYLSIKKQHPLKLQLKQENEN